VPASVAQASVCASRRQLSVPADLPPVQRRALLSLCGTGVAALAGCTDQLPTSGDDDQPDDQPSDSPADSPTNGSPTSGARRVAMGESVTVDGATLRVEHPRVHPTVVQDASAWQSLRVPDGQFLVVDVTTEGSVPERLHEMTLTGSVDGKPLGDDPTLVVEGEDPGGPYSPREWEQRRLAFPFPAESHEDVSVHWERGETTVRWTVGESLRAALANPPTFRVEEFSANRTDAGDVALDLAVANEGPRDARFQMWVSFEAIADASSIVSLDVPAGGTANYEAVPPILHYEGAEVVTVAFRAGGEEQRVELEVPPAHETATASDTSGGSDTATHTETATDAATDTGTVGDAGSMTATPAPEPRTATADE
jgi:hypothetical protein